MVGVRKHSLGLSLTVLAVLGGLSLPVRAQPFGWFFGAPEHRHTVKRRRPARPAPLEEAPQAVEVPLPPPRPHFPGDAPAPDSVAAKSSPEAPAKPAETAKAAKPAETAAPPTPESPAGTTQTATAPPPGPSAPMPPPKPTDLSKSPTAPPSNLPSPGAGKPGVAASGARLGEAPGQPVDDAACPGRLKDRKVAAEPVSIGPQPDPRCTVVEAVRLTGLTLPDGGQVEFPDRPTIACPTADTFSLFVRDLLSPLAKGTYGAPVAAVWTGPGLECRSRDHIFGAKLSAHGQGLAIDIAQIKLGNGRMVEVGRPDNETDTGFQTAARAAACGYFHTALGPGTDDYHRTHWHFDLDVRGAHGDSKYCK